MQIGDFNSGVSGRFRSIASSGEPQVVTWQHKPYVTIASTDLFDDLVDAAGEAGQDVLKRHREAAEQCKREAAA